jgi:hypothetical protein
LIFGCTFAEFIVLSPEEQQRGLPGFTELGAMALAVNDAKIAPGGSPTYNNLPKNNFEEN